MKSNSIPPDLNKLMRRKPTQAEINESYRRAAAARGGSWPDKLKPEDEQRKP